MMQKMSTYYRPTDHRSFISSPDWAVMLQQHGYQGPKLQTIKNDNEFTYNNNQSAPPYQHQYHHHRQKMNCSTKMPAPTTEKFKNRYTCT